jgi:ubiquinone/menaquinone biosynthesis C-methylase UbiE
MAMEVKVGATEFGVEHFLGNPIVLGGYGVDKRLSAARRFLSWTDCIVADIGCGNGAYTEAIAQDAKTVIGVDLQASLVESFRERIAPQDHVVLACAAAEFLPLRSHAVDVAFCIETLEHMANDVLGLEELYRILRPGGHLILTVPNKWFIFETHGLKGGPISGNRIPLVSWLPGAIHSRIAAARIYTNGQLRRMVERTGFENVQVDYVMPPLDKVPSPKLRNVMRQMIARLESGPIRRFGVSLVVCAQKPWPDGESESPSSEPSRMSSRAVASDVR